MDWKELVSMLMSEAQAGEVPNPYGAQPQQAAHAPVTGQFPVQQPQPPQGRPVAPPQPPVGGPQPYMPSQFNPAWSRESGTAMERRLAENRIPPENPFKSKWQMLVDRVTQPAPAMDPGVAEKIHTPTDDKILQAAASMVPLGRLVNGIGAVKRGLSSFDESFSPQQHATMRRSNMQDMPKSSQGYVNVPPGAKPTNGPTTTIRPPVIPKDAPPGLQAELRRIYREVKSKERSKGPNVSEYSAAEKARVRSASRNRNRLPEQLARKGKLDARTKDILSNFRPGGY